MSDDNLFPRLDKIDETLNALLDREEPTLKYKIETSDKQDHWLAFHGSDFYHTLWDLDQELRSIAKYGAEEQGLDVDTLDHVRSMIHELMTDNGIDFEHIS